MKERIVKVSVFVRKNNIYFIDLELTSAFQLFMLSWLRARCVLFQLLIVLHRVKSLPIGNNVNETTVRFVYL